MTGYLAPPADDAALEALLRDRRFGPPDRHESTPWDFARRWPDATLRDRVWPIVSRFLVDADALVRVRAVELVRVWTEARALTRARVLDVAEQHPELYGDEAPEGITLRYELAFALCNGLDDANRARTVAVVREMARHEPIGGGAAGVLGQHEPAFFAAQARRWGDAHALWILEGARSLALFRRDEIVPMLHALRDLGHATRVDVVAVVERSIRRDDAAATLLAQGLPPPIKPPPSVEECKRAIGL